MIFPEKLFTHVVWISETAGLFNLGYLQLFSVCDGTMDRTLKPNPVDPVLDGKKKREFDFSRYPKRRIALMFLYFGWEYNGLVEQRENGRTVSSILF